MFFFVCFFYTFLFPYSQYFLSCFFISFKHKFSQYVPYHIAKNIRIFGTMKLLQNKKEDSYDLSSIRKVIKNIHFSIWFDVGRSISDRDRILVTKSRLSRGPHSFPSSGLRGFFSRVKMSRCYKLSNRFRLILRLECDPYVPPRHSPNLN